METMWKFNIINISCAALALVYKILCLHHIIVIGQTIDRAIILGLWHIVVLSVIMFVISARAKADGRLK